MNINLSKFHKIECDDHCTTLEHPGGHQIRIAHQGLSPEVRKELDQIPLKMAKGGYAKFSQRYDPNMKASKPSGPSSPLPQAAYTPPKEAKNAFTEPDNMGTADAALASLHKEAPPFGPLGTEEKQHYPPCINPSCKSYGHPHPNCRCYGGVPEAGHFAEGGKVGGYCSEDRPHQEDCQFFKAGGMAEGEQAMEPTPQTEEPVATPPQQADPMAVNLSKQDINPNPEATSTTSEQAPAPQDAAPQQPADPMQQFQQHKENSLNQLSSETQAFNNDLNNGHIKPETYHDLFAKKDTLGKIGTMFGLLLGGAGSGLTHQPSVIMSMMNKEIDNDLNAQQASATNRQNFLKINQQNLLNQAQIKGINAETNAKAYALAKIQMNYAALHKLVVETQKLPPGPQRDQAMQNLAMMSQSVQNENFNIIDRAASGAAFYKTLFGNQGDNASSDSEQNFQNQVKSRKALGPEGQKMADDMESKHYPGIPGQASMPLTNEDRAQIHSGLAFDRALNNFKDWAKKHSGDLNPKDRAYGQSLAADLQGAYRQATHGGVYKEGEQNFISTVIDSEPTKFFNSIRVIPKLDAASDQNKMRLDQILKDKGYKGYPGAQKQGDSGQKAQTKVVNGVTYKRGPNGEAIRVK